MPRRSTRNKYKPKTVVKWTDDSNWLCFCDNGPERDWQQDEKKVVLCCDDNCISYGHVKCYGLSEIYEEGGSDWEGYMHLCMDCK